ncbi:MAG: hydroxysqualene dehydroxylase HpnE [Nitrosomonadales bacterium]|nr:hydroxysqualene dehydroxylase HpnE [Nitrosomonadales bacterium]
MHVAVIGGGCAGLAAAARLAEQHIPVTLFESSPQLGGRARGIQWKGQSLDNGQHILLGAYSETLSLLRLAGVAENQAMLRLPLQLTMQPDFDLRACNALPAPLHILAGLIQAKGLSWRDRWSAVRFMSWMKLIDFKLKQDVALGTLLNNHGQSPKLAKMLWEPLCLAALNTPLASASAQVFINVLRDSFSKAKSDSDMLLPRLDLSQLMAEPLACFIRNNGGHIKTGISVDGLQQQNRQFSVTTADGNITNFSHAIIAVSPFRLPALVKHLPALDAAARLCKAMQYQPICTVYVQYPEHVKLPSPMTGLTAGLGQWVFDRGRLYGQRGLIAVVISAEGEHQELSQPALINRVTEELGIAFPTLVTQLSQPLWHKVITEKRATFACSVDLERPQMITDTPQLYLAGDYIAGDYPATIEGAVRSGTNAAKAIIQSI